MTTKLSLIHSPLAVQTALDEFSSLGRSAFLQKYGFPKSKDFLIRNPLNGMLCDCGAILAAAYSIQYSNRGALTPEDLASENLFATSVLQNIGFEVVRIGEDWTQQEVDATVASYFEMLLLESKQEKYNKSERNALLRLSLNGRTKASVEMKHQNISSVLHGMDLPFIPGYKPRGNTQLLLRKAVQKFLLDRPYFVRQIIDALEETAVPEKRQYRAVIVEPPSIDTVTQLQFNSGRLRHPRKVDFAARDEANRHLGRLGEQWVLGFEQSRLLDAGTPELFQQVDWVSDRLGDGAGYDILSYEVIGQPRYIEVKTTNGPHATAFVVSRNELEFSQERTDAFYLYRVFQFRQAPMLYILRGDLLKQLMLEPIDYRASFKRYTG